MTETLWTTHFRPTVAINCHEWWWISIEELLNGDPVNYPSEDWAYNLAAAREDSWYPSLRERIVEHGFTCPISVINGRLGNGHHRIAIAIDEGWDEIPVMDQECHCPCTLCPEPPISGGEW